MTDRALLVGIDEYRVPGNTLNSCVADTLAFQTLIDATFGIRGDAVTLIHNTSATLDAVRDGLAWLFDGAQAGDHRVFFQSSHGYQRAEGDTMVEMLCVYDGFLRDEELTSLTQKLRAGVRATVVVDACHSGGMDKMFFADDGPRLAAVKAFRPPADEAVRDAEAMQQVTAVKFFGRQASEDAGTLAERFHDPLSAAAIAPAKDFAGGKPTLNAVLFAACGAGQTAAAGSATTSWLSAFTYALTTQVRLASNLPIADLCKRISAQLGRLAMLQNPVVEAPLDEMLDQTFLGMDRPTARDTATATSTYLRSATGSNGPGKEFDDAAGAEFQRLATRVTAALEADQAPGAADASAFAAALMGSVGSVQMRARRDVAEAQRIGRQPSLALEDPAQLASEDFVRSVFSAVSLAAPALLRSLATTQPPSLSDELAGVPAQRRDDPEWVEFVVGTLRVLGPAFVDAVTGRTDFSDPALAPDLAIPDGHAGDASWINDGLAAAVRLMPSAVELLTP